MGVGAYITNMLYFSLTYQVTIIFWNIFSVANPIQAQTKKMAILERSIC